MNSKEKTAFRKTSKWKNWCKYLKDKRGPVCECCGVKTKRLQCHHKAEWDYTNLKEDRFSLLCSRCHQQVSFLERIKPENWKNYNPEWVSFYKKFLLTK